MHPMKKIIKEVRTDLTSSNLPAMVMKEERPTSFFATLLTRGKHYSIEGLDNPRGSPRYVSGKEPLLQLRVLTRISLLSSEMLMGMRLDLW